MRSTNNITDIFRFIACFCIVWFHSSYYGLLDGSYQRPLVDEFKLYTIMWAMPFFYVVSSRLALKSMINAPISKVLSKIQKLLVIIFICIVIYDIPNYILYEGYSRYPFHLFVRGDSFSAIIQDAWNTFISVNYSPGYFLIHLIVIYAFAFLASRVINNVIGRGSIIVICTGVLFGITFVPLDVTNVVSSYLLLNKLALGTMAIGFLYESLNISKFVKNYSPKSSIVVMMSIMIPIVIMGFVYGRLHWGELNGTPWKASIPIWMSIFFLYIGDKFSTIDLKWCSKISEWGRDYSFGVFILHYWVLIWISLIIPKVGAFLGYHNPSLIVFVLINVVGFLVALIFTYFLGKSRITRGFINVGTVKRMF
ncbi:Acyltransferase family protein [Fontibacillus panacisegetis]|uniref:Acyltransferase family protein n=1 Tax=Fontibacillus panacisegetis TaxID=670482 RepID=A0A1G7T267_9BACL|nr:acyltransferase [Fontibacillus panacisegetis]SDG28680.1 Acyltransferase family protein [Fontibacillus panacisegetis]